MTQNKGKQLLKEALRDDGRGWGGGVAERGKTEPRNLSGRRRGDEGRRDEGRGDMYTRVVTYGRMYLLFRLLLCLFLNGAGRQKTVEEDCQGRREVQKGQRLPQGEAATPLSPQHTHTYTHAVECAMI